MFHPFVLLTDDSEQSGAVPVGYFSRLDVAEIYFGHYCLKIHVKMLATRVAEAYMKRSSRLAYQIDVTRLGKLSTSLG